MATTITVGKLRYDPNKVLGRGSFGTVFSGFHVYLLDASQFHTENSTPVAVKRVEKGLVDEAVLRKEEELMKKSSHHSNILQLIHTEINTEFLFVAMQLCSGTLGDYITGNKYQGPRFSNETEILRQVTRGLAHLHRLRIVHRDIKPTNILIFVSPSTEGAESKPQIKLADFDISKLLKTDQRDFTNTSPTNPSGSRGWMAPEIYKSNRFDFKVDVWALGLIFGYTLSGGKHPYGDDPDLRTARIKQNEPMLLTKDDLMDTCNKDGAFKLIELMLKVKAKNRPTVTYVLKDPFFINEVRTAKLLDVCKSFQESITHEKIVQFKQLVSDETVDVDATTMTKYKEEMGPLHLMVYCYREIDLIELLKYLLFHGADVNSKAKTGGFIIGSFITEMTPLHSLFFNSENMMSNVIDIVQLFLTNGADVNAKNQHGITPLHYLCGFYRKDDVTDIAQLLIEKGADVNAKDGGEWTPLHFVYYFRKREITDLINQSLVLFLLEKGADIDAKERN